jgi:cytidylate kinase
LAKMAHELDVVFSLENDALTVVLEGDDVSTLIRSEQAGNAASKVAALPDVRAALLDRQRDFCQSPGLVTDGRDMGTVVFPEAKYKVFLTASTEVRAERRYKQLKEKGIESNLSDLITEISERDNRDSQRAVAPLKAATDALVLDSSAMGIDVVFERVSQLLADS